MKREISKLSKQEFDLLIIGGGIYGACAAWDAALRGLSVALIDKGDFGGATSANSLKIIHGGFRYLQQLDIKRMRNSIRERMILMKIAPHLIHPLPSIMPTYGYKLYSKISFFFALKINDMIGFDRNKLNDPQKFIPKGRIISKQEFKNSFPGLNYKKITGGALWHDGMVHNSERLTLSFLRSAVNCGAIAANYIKAEKFIVKDGKVTGVTASDFLNGEKIKIRARCVINTAGPWVNELLSDFKEDYRISKPKMALAMNLVVNRKVISKYALGSYGMTSYKSEDYDNHRGRQILFATPWRGCTLIGTKYIPIEGKVDDCSATEKEAQIFLNEINDTFPGASIKSKEVASCHVGVVPIDGTNEKTGQVILKNKHNIIDHLQHDGVDGLISAISIKLTSARGIAEKTIDLLLKKLGRKPLLSKTDFTPIWGGAIDNREEFIKGEIKKDAFDLGKETIRELIYNYGSKYEEVLKYHKKSIHPRKQHKDSSEILKARVLYAVREEMAQKLSDIIFRRTELGLIGDLDEECLKTCADIMANELRWDEDRTKKELKEVKVLCGPVI